MCRLDFYTVLYILIFKNHRAWYHYEQNEQFPYSKGFSIFYGSPLPCKTNLLEHGVFSRQHTFRNIYLYFHFAQLVWPFLAQQAPGLYLSHHSHYNWPKGNEWSSFMLPFWCLAACSGHVVFRPNWFFFRSLTVQVVVCLMSERCLSLG